VRRARCQFGCSFLFDRRSLLYGFCRRMRRSSHFRLGGWRCRGPVDRGRFRFVPGLGFGWSFRRPKSLMAERDPQLIRYIVIDRAGMSLLIVHAKFGKFVEDLVRLYLEFPCQLVNSNLLHSETIASAAPWGRSPGLPGQTPRPVLLFDLTRVLYRTRLRLPRFRPGLFFIGFRHRSFLSHRGFERRRLLLRF
jgi:hypothetical protein